MLTIISITAVHIEKAIFEAIGQIVKQVKDIVPEKTDYLGRNSLLTSYIDYVCLLPYSDTPNSGNHPLL